MVQEQTEEIPSAEERLRAAFTKVRNPMLIVDDQRRYVNANPAACRLLGVELDEVSWHRLDDFTPLPDRRLLVSRWEDFLATGGLAGTFRVLRPSGSLVTIEFGATANIVPGRHLSVVIPVDEVERAVELDAQEGWVRLSDRHAEQQQLTAREREVLALVAAGMQGMEIAERLTVSPETVKSHVQNTMLKLGAHTRAHAVAVALSTGQIDLSRDLD